MIATTIPNQKKIKMMISQTSERVPTELKRPRVRRIRQSESQLAAKQVSTPTQFKSELITFWESVFHHFKPFYFRWFAYYYVYKCTFSHKKH